MEALWVGVWAKRLVKRLVALLATRLVALLEKVWDSASGKE